MKTCFLAQLIDQLGSNSQHCANETGHSPKSAKKALCLWCRLHISEKNAEPIWRRGNSLGTPKNDYVDYDPAENRDKNPSRRSSPPFTIFIFRHPTRQTGEEEINEKKHGKDQRGREADVFDSIFRRRRHRETFGKRLAWWQFQCINIFLGYTRPTLRGFDGVSSVHLRNGNRSASWNLHFLFAPGNRDSLAIALQCELNRKLFVWFQFQRTKIVLTDSPATPSSFDGVTTLDLRNDALGVLWKHNFLFTPRNLGHLAIAAQCEFNWGIQKHSGRDCPQAKAGEGRSQRHRTEPPE